MAVLINLFCIFTFFILALTLSQNDQTRKISIAAPGAEQRVALVIGNSDYRVKPLPNPVNDASDMAETLRGIGFKVIERKNLDYKQMLRAIEVFGKEIQNGGVGLFYYAGHGAQVKGENYLVPIGANIARESQLPYEAVNMGRVLEVMEQAHNRLNILILDACRDDPFVGGNRSGSRGLAIVNAPSGTLIAYSTSPGLTAADGEGRNSPYTEALLKVMGEPGLLVESAFKQVRNLVRAKTGGVQTPWEVSSLEGDFSFVAGKAAKVEPPPRQEHVEIETYTETVNQVGIEMVRVPGGKFTMGSPVDEEGRLKDEGPQHDVTISSFYMGKFEVTQKQWQAVSLLPKIQHDLKPKPARFKADDRPVEQVNWEEAVEFCERLSKATGKKYRLPTEAEWEYANRAGTTGLFAGKVDAMAWYGENFLLGSSHPVGRKQANRFGLFDMHGNVWEWCSDWYREDYYFSSPDGNPQGPDSGAGHVVRGGGWHHPARNLRSASRGWVLPGLRSNDLGFRIVRTYE